MIDISINKVCKSYGFGNVLDNVSFDINSGEIISIVGENGSGKSTLLKVIAKEENPSSGIISIRKGASIGYLSQIADLSINDKVKDIAKGKYISFVDVRNCINKNFYEKLYSLAKKKKLKSVSKLVFHKTEYSQLPQLFYTKITKIN